jgi:L-ascorbate metabolism protein UlaG (beta-lactamase superfamily)
MEITWYGLSCFRLVERGKATIVTDPYDHREIGSESLKLKSDVVTISHDAPGHNFVDAVKGAPHLINGPGEYEIGGVFITGVSTNGSKKATDETDNTLYVFDYGDVTVAHLGDLKRVPNQVQIETLGQVDIAMVPVGGGGGLNAAKAAEIINMLEPSIVIPMHYHTPGITVELLPLSRFLKEMGLGEVHTRESLIIKHSEIPEETRVEVLELHK